MNYLKVYCNLIRKAENRTPPEGYTEKHHTFPVSIFGKNKRIVVLTAREHYIAHALLERICMKRYGPKDQKTIKMTYAFWVMNTADKYGTRYKNSHIYSCLRERYVSNKKGFKMSEEARKKMSKSKRGRKLSKKEVERVRNLCIKHNIGGYERTEKHILRLKECNKVYVYEIIGPNGERFIVDNMNEFCYNNPQYGLHRSAMNRVGRGKQKAHKGWKVTIIKEL
jgi:hypothetical protein